MSFEIVSFKENIVNLNRSTFIICYKSSPFHIIKRTSLLISHYLVGYILVSSTIFIIIINILFVSTQSTIALHSTIII